MTLNKTTSTFVVAALLVGSSLAAAQTANTLTAAKTSGGTGIAAGVTLPAGVPVYALTSDNAIYVLRPGSGQYTRLGRVNTPDGGNLIGIDFRPADNTPTKLYGLTDLGTLYNIDVSAARFGQLTQVSKTNPRFTGGFGAVVDFNPVVNALRIMGSNDQNLAVVNGENAAHGFGISQEIHQKLLACGADVVTLGNHAFDQRETLVFIEREPNLIRPLNWPAGCPGRGTCMVETAKGQRVLVMNAMGRVMIEPVLDDPFPAIGRELDQCQLGRDCDAILIDFHGEASSEKMAIGHYVDGRASLLVGTHTHSPTADHHILAGGTGYMTDAGMCGDYDSVIGMDKVEPLNRFLRKLPVEKFKPAEGAATVCGVAVETDDKTGLATLISPIRIGGRLSQAEVPFW